MTITVTESHAHRRIKFATVLACPRAQLFAISNARDIVCSLWWLTDHERNCNPQYRVLFVDVTSIVGSPGGKPIESTKRYFEAIYEDETACLKEINGGSSKGRAVLGPSLAQLKINGDAVSGAECSWTIG